MSARSCLLIGETTAIDLCSIPPDVNQVDRDYVYAEGKISKRNSVISMMEDLTPSRPVPEFFTPP